MNRVLLALAMMAAAACVADDTSEASFAVADSAGVEVVTTTRPAWSNSGSPWRLTLEMEMGELEGSEPYLFGDPVSAVRLKDGRIAVADAQSADVRFFDMNGGFLYRAGRGGQGPGEFTSFSWLARCEDGLLAYDWQQRRATPTSLGGEAGDPFPVPTPEEGRPVYHSRCLPDGSFLALGWAELSPGDSAMRRWLEAAEYPMPERYPAYTDLLVDPLGYIWVERFVTPWQPDHRAWGVFDPDGVFLGHLQVPPAFDITDVTEDHVVGVAHDDLGVPRIRVYRLDRLDAN